MNKNSTLELTDFIVNQNNKKSRVTLDNLELAHDLRPKYQRVVKDRAEIP